MKLPTVLFAARLPQNVDNVPFKEMLPLKLKPKVSGKGDNTTEVYCLYEMSVLFACLKNNEFDQKFCGNEIKSFQKCYVDSVSLKQGKKEKESKGILVPGEKKLSHRQLNTLLRKYPNI